MKNKPLCLLVLLASHVHALAPIALQEGVTPLDLNQDGVKDYVVAAEFDNNTSHPNLGLTFFIRRPDGGHSIVPVANSNLFTWFDYRLSAAADFLLQDNRLFFLGKKYYLVTAKKIEESVFDPGKVSLTIYRFSESQDDPGVPRYEWAMHRTIIAQHTYQSAAQAYQEVDETMLSK